MTKHESDDIKKILDKVRIHLDLEEFNEGLSILETLPQSPETDELKNQLQTKKHVKIQKLLEDTLEFMANNLWRNAENLINQAKTLDEEDKAVKAIVSRYTREYQDYLKSKKLRNDLQTAKLILDKEVRNLKDIEKAIDLLESAGAEEIGNPEIHNMLDKAKKLRREILRKIGVIETYEQVGKYEEALEEIESLIERGETLYKERDIEEYRADLQAKVWKFSERKAKRRLESALDTLPEDPRLALKHIDKGLDLTFIPKELKEDLEDIKLKVEQAIEDLEKAEAEINLGLKAMYEKYNYQEAIRIFQGVIAKHPQLHDVQSHLKDAVKAHRIQITKRIKRNLNEARLQIKLNNLEKAKKLIQEINTLSGSYQDPEIMSYHDQCDKLMAMISEQESSDSKNKKHVKVFISYYKSDKDDAKKLYNDLKRAGAKPWMDSEDLLPGKNWREEIYKAIEDSSYFLILLSKNSISKKGYIHKEREIALEFLDELPSNNIYVIPVRLEDFNPIPMKLRKLRCVDLFPSYEKGLERILSVLANEESKDN
ncbi:MAG: TIR domain-containing protein [Desulfobacterales bacterium]|nr:TIR domain-containing protein [Desulfobacterales bacterium]